MKAEPLVDGPGIGGQAEFGAVLLKDWMPNPVTGGNVNQVIGPLQLVTAKAAFGFSPKGNETNWGVLVGTPENNVLILGCQIRGVYWGKKFNPPGVGVNTWEL